jgi:hypothetical protein
MQEMRVNSRQVIVLCRPFNILHKLDRLTPERCGHGSNRPADGNLVRT